MNKINVCKENKILSRFLWGVSGSALHPFASFSSVSWTLSSPLWLETIRFMKRKLVEISKWWTICHDECRNTDSQLSYTKLEPRQWLLLNNKECVSRHPEVLLIRNNNTTHITYNKVSFSHCWLLRLGILVKYMRLTERKHNQIHVDSTKTHKHLDHRVTFQIWIHILTFEKSKVICSACVYQWHNQWTKCN